MTGLGIVRLLMLGGGAFLLLGGLAAVVVGGIEGVVGGMWLVVAGAVLMLAVAFERTRYRSENAERRADPPGPGGGEHVDAPLEPRFRRTAEVFEDPTSRRRMRVWVDPSSGERRYRAED